ncbi:unnamed protein product [Aspergillus oryzae RIB40]|uniref:DNA, SC111 n=1 Tax=Aspergillus oryzae (strain ATCC 42149 / RIB 40) TaxID=510516 RepID=Q2U8X3_ASPOR|nr:unnamed protein product [Aspergillus oryzae RIB40]BAE61992.1 unnamed protein product [Aspergillus oryzae RIB40]
MALCLCQQSKISGAQELIRLLFDIDLLHLLIDLNIRSRKIPKGNMKRTKKYASQVNGKEIIPGTSQLLETCGRSSAASGTEGTLELWDKTQRICKLYWDCPWGSKVNKFKVQEKYKTYRVEVGPWNSYGGALGNVDVEISRKRA